MKNNISDLNNLLFEQIERLMDDTGDIDLEKESKRAELVCKVSDQIIKTGQLQLNSIKVANDCGVLSADMPELVKSKAVKQIGYKL